MNDLYSRVQETADAICKRAPLEPRIAIILGTGLSGGLVQHVEQPAFVPYLELPNMPLPTVITHQGRFILGRFAGKPTIVMDGRFHRYEGYDLQQVTFPLRVFRRLGVETLIVTNVAGGLNPDFSTGAIVIIQDHINLMGDNPLVGVRDERLGPRFPDMSQPYNKKLIALAQRVALEQQIATRLGVYVALTGPSLETRAEYRFLRQIGADMVGMSTVPEVIVAAQCGLKTVGFSIISDMCLPDALEPADITRIIAAANAAEPPLTRLILKLVEAL